jgi:hypothetical protein
MTPGGKAMFQIMGVFAEFKRAMIEERVRACEARGAFSLAGIFTADLFAASRRRFWFSKSERRYNICFPTCLDSHLFGRRAREGCVVLNKIRECFRHAEGPRDKLPLKLIHN